MSEIDIHMIGATFGILMMSGFVSFMVSVGWHYGRKVVGSSALVEINQQLPAATSVTVNKADRLSTPDARARG